MTKTTTESLAEKIREAESRWNPSPEATANSPKNWNGPKFASLTREQKEKWPIKTLIENQSAMIEKEYMITGAASSSLGLKDEARDPAKNLWASPGLQNDNAKSRVDLLDPDFLLAVGDALRFGAEKYKEHGGSSNWRRGINISRLVASALRHLLAIMRGEDIDSESGLPHTAHLGCCVQFLHWTLKHKPEFDDRFRY